MSLISSFFIAFLGENFESGWSRVRIHYSEAIFFLSETLELTALPLAVQTGENIFDFEMAILTRILLTICWMILTGLNKYIIIFFSQCS
ncbi:hypothetical protein DSUL_60183 [Desulfovibrionales bacterium]